MLPSAESPEDPPPLARTGIIASTALGEVLIDANKLYRDGRAWRRVRFQRVPAPRDARIQRHDGGPDEHEAGTYIGFELPKKPRFPETPAGP